ncbi:MAG: hypothetical protein JNL41_08430 [Phenylobacterium sp.]|uniref:hypothetical protein n=1 Tax=Phenylobacterium sp. TaxID=1871053 RepID=UPI001A4F1D67|nr:hypothetical protein [Phenylobacterium sp.]MBL8554290.1 hypothetical protein [Phenylobacterium sp.]
MRITIFALGLLALAPTASAQPEAPAPAPAARPHATYTLETPIHTLMEDPVTLAWLDRHFPGMSARMRDPEVGTLFDGVSIQGLSIDPDHGRALTPEVMAKLAVSLEKAQADAAGAKP